MVMLIADTFFDVSVAFITAQGTPLEVGKGVVRRSGKDACLFAYGSSVNEALAAAEMLETHGVSVTVVDARFCKPLDAALLRQVGGWEVMCMSAVLVQLLGSGC
jgi:deoxyxylulose-5-phosphate synthase